MMFTNPISDEPVLSYRVDQHGMVISPYQIFSTSQVKYPQYGKKQIERIWLRQKNSKIIIFIPGGILSFSTNKG